MEAKELHPQETFWFLKLDDLKVIVSWNLYISYLVIATPSPSIFLQVVVQLLVSCPAKSVTFLTLSQTTSLSLTQP